MVLVKSLPWEVVGRELLLGEFHKSLDGQGSAELASGSHDEIVGVVMCGTFTVLRELLNDSHLVVPVRDSVMIEMWSCCRCERQVGCLIEDE